MAADLRFHTPNRRALRPVPGTTGPGESWIPVASRLPLPNPESALLTVGEYNVNGGKVVRTTALPWAMAGCLRSIRNLAIAALRISTVTRRRGWREILLSTYSEQTERAGSLLEPPEG